MMVSTHQGTVRGDAMGDIAVDWYVPNKVVRVPLRGKLYADSLQALDKEVHAFLALAIDDVALVFDAREVDVSYDTAAYLRKTQTYLTNHVTHAFLVTDNKLTKLVTLMAFGSAHPHFRQFDSFDALDKYMHLRGIV